MAMKFRIFRGVLRSWRSLFREAAAFASELGPERVVAISHSDDQADSVVTVWYDDGPKSSGSRVVAFESYRGDFSKWDRLNAEAASLVDQIGRENLLTISHSADKAEGLITVWYWR